MMESYILQEKHAPRELSSIQKQPTTAGAIIPSPPLSYLGRQPPTPPPHRATTLCTTPSLPHHRLPFPVHAPSPYCCSTPAPPPPLPPQHPFCTPPRPARLLPRQPSTRKKSTPPCLQGAPALYTGCVHTTTTLPSHHLRQHSTKGRTPPAAMILFSSSSIFRSLLRTSLNSSFTFAR